MNIEIESKLKVESLEDVKRRLVELGDEFTNEKRIKHKVLASEKVIAAMAGEEAKKIIVIKSRLVNIVR